MSGEVDTHTTIAPGSKGWYLLSGIPTTVDAGVAGKYSSHYNVGTTNNNATAHLTDFESLIVQNTKGFHEEATNKDSANNNIGKMTFGATIYFFDHRKSDYANVDDVTAGTDKDGWNPSNNYMQNNWSTINIGTYKWSTDRTYTNATATAVAGLGASNAVGTGTTYGDIPIDCRFGYWVYIVSSN